MNINDGCIAGTATAKDLNVDIENLPFLNIALQQNNIPFVFELKLNNGLARELSAIEAEMLVLHVVKRLHDRETVRIFGFTSMSVRMKPHLELSLNHLRQCGRI